MSNTPETANKIIDCNITQQNFDIWVTWWWVT